MSGIVLRGLLWDHPRCTGPMQAAARSWQRAHPDVRIEWSARPLAAFNDQPVHAVAADFDIVFVDHPAIGECVEAGSLCPLDELLSVEFLAATAAASIGGSHRSYHADGKQWALAVDVACHVSVSRTDLLEAAEEKPPATWADTLALMHRYPGRVAWPLYPTDAILSVLSISASLQGLHDDLEGRPIEELFSLEAFDILMHALPELHRLSLSANPPAVLDRMRDTDDIWYAPLVFGYSTYQRPGGRARLDFGAVPAAGPAAGCSTLGGAGAAVTRTSQQPQEAARFVAWLCDAGTQREIVIPNGGQPDGRAVWTDPAADAVVGGFFSSTLPMLEHAVLRPRHAGWPALQQTAGAALTAAIANRTPPRQARDAVLHAGARSNVLPLRK